MPKFGPGASPRLRATYALPLAMLILMAILFGTPGRNDGPVARAQTPLGFAQTTPASSHRIRNPRNEAFPVPEELRGLDISRQTLQAAAAKSDGCITCHQGQHDPHFKPETVRLGCVDCHGGNPQAADEQAAHVWPRFPGRVAKLPETLSGPTPS